MILHGDCLDIMPTLDAESIDAIVTDPPYGLQFMGKEWDRLGGIGKTTTSKPTASSGSLDPSYHAAFGRLGGVTHGGSANRKCGACGKWEWDHVGRKCECERPDFPNVARHQGVLMQAWHEAWAREALRVAKPGAYLLAFGGTRTVHRLACAIEDAGWIIRDLLVWGYASGFPKGRANLKPAWEPIVMARKPGPLRPLAIDECRIGTEPTVTRIVGGSGFGANFRDDGWEPPAESSERENAGRWPANVILTDEVFGEEMSRFFLVPKAARSDREPVLGGLEESARRSTGYGGMQTRVCNACGNRTKELGRGGGWPNCGHDDWRWDDQREVGHKGGNRANSHPTVKPTELMRHLVRLVTPQGGTVLDPFLGSGTTALAAEMEGFAWVGIEREAEYVAIAEARLNGTQKGLAL